MSNFTLKNYEDQLNHQVIHMDQALCYCPEFRASHLLHDYPSRKLQLARAVYKGELEPTDFTAALMFQSILSRQGERWQNFGENPEDLTDVMLLCREMLLKKGYGTKYTKELEALLEENKGHILPQEDIAGTWEKAVATTPGCGNYLLLDDATAFYAKDSAKALGLWFESHGIVFEPDIKPAYTGFEYFAYGLIEKGIEHLKALVNTLKGKKIKVVYTLSGQSTYLLTTFAEKLDIEVPFKVVYLPDTVKALNTEAPAYVYGGSFVCRYLGKAQVINDLLRNTISEPVLNCQEFMPLLKADKRLNELNIWQKPVCAEYRLVGFDADMAQKITADAIADIQKANADQIVVFEPYAYEQLKQAFPDKRVSWYFEVI